MKANGPCRSSYAVLVPIITGLAGLLVFLFWEFRYASEPIIERRIFSTWTAISTYIQTLLHGLVTWAALYFLGKFRFTVMLLAKNKRHLTDQTCL